MTRPRAFVLGGTLSLLLASSLVLPTDAGPVRARAAPGQQGAPGNPLVLLEVIRKVP